MLWIDPDGACPPRTLYDDADHVAARGGVVVAGDLDELSATVLPP